jgi:hypothetical protein
MLELGCDAVVTEVSEDKLGFSVAPSGMASAKRGMTGAEAKDRKEEEAKIPALQKTEEDKIRKEQEDLKKTEKLNICLKRRRADTVNYRQLADIRIRRPNRTKEEIEKEKTAKAVKAMNRSSQKKMKKVAAEIVEID